MVIAVVSLLVSLGTDTSLRRVKHEGPTTWNLVLGSPSYSSWVLSRHVLLLLVLLLLILNNIPINVRYTHRAVYSDDTHMEQYGHKACAQNSTAS